jgi:hypothetical protein
MVIKIQHLKLSVINSFNFLMRIFTGIILWILWKLIQSLNSFPILRRWLIYPISKTTLYTYFQRLHKKINSESPSKKVHFFLRSILVILLKLIQLLNSFPILRRWLFNVILLLQSYLTNENYVSNVMSVREEKIYLQIKSKYEKNNRNGFQ